MHILTAGGKTKTFQLTKNLCPGMKVHCVLLKGAFYLQSNGIRKSLSAVDPSNLTTGADNSSLLSSHWSAVQTGQLCM